MRYFLRDDGRYYLILDPALDLLGDEVVVVFNGSRDSRLGQVRTFPSAAFDASTVVRKRLQHGYREVDAWPVGNT